MEYVTNMQAYEKLCNAVVLQTVRDYVSALRRKKEHNYDMQADRTINDCERFFKKDMSFYSDEDGTVIMNMITEHLDEIDITRLVV